MKHSSLFIFTLLLIATNVCSMQSRKIVISKKTREQQQQSNQNSQQNSSATLRQLVTKEQCTAFLSTVVQDPEKNVTTLLKKYASDPIPHELREGLVKFGNDLKEYEITDSHIARLMDLAFDEDDSMEL